MIKRTFHFSFKVLLEIIAIVFTSIMILFGGFIYYIYSNPVKLESLNPYIQDVLKDAYPNLELQSKQGLLTFKEGNFVVTFDGVYVSGISSKSIIEINKLNLAFPLAAIFDGIPSKVEVDDMNLVFNINKEGAFSLKVSKENIKKEKDSADVSSIVLDILSNRKLYRLKEISFTNSNFSVINEITENSWDLKDVNVLFKREKNGNIVGSANLNLQGENVNFTSFYDSSENETYLRLAFKNLDLDKFSNKYEALKDFKIKTTGEMVVNLGKDLKIDYVESRGNIAKGSSIYLREYMDKETSISGNFDLLLDDDKIISKKLNLNLGGLKTTSHLTLDLIKQKENIDYKFNYNLGIYKTTFEKVFDSWSKKLAPEARDWVVNNLKDGQIDKFNLQLKGDYKDGKLQNETINGALDFSNLTVRYVDTMPPIKNGKGVAKFNQNRFDILVNEGNIDDFKIVKGSKVIVPFKNTIVDVDAKIEGNLNTLAKVIDYKPLEYIKGMDLIPGDFSGQISGDLKMKIPDDGENVTANVEAEFKNTSVNNLLFERNISNANGKLKINNDKLEVNAKGDFTQYSTLDVKWEEFYNKTAAVSSKAAIKGYMDVALLKDLDVIDVTSFFKGRMPIDANYEKKGKNTSISVKSNLVGSEVNLSPIPYKKSKEKAASLAVKVKLLHDEFQQMEAIELKEEGKLNLKGWYDDNILYLSELSMPKNKINISGYWESIKGKVPKIDVSGIIGDKVSLEIKKKDNRNTISFDVVNLGDTLKSLELFENLKGGVLSLTGESTKDDLSILKGELLLTNFNVVKMDILTTLLGALSLDGLSSALSGEGISFEKLSADYTWDYNKDQFIFKDGKTSGSSLGLTFDTIWDIANSTLAMNGTIAPLQGVNRVIGNIPIIGSVLTGSGKEGVFGAKYTIKGKLSDLKVDVNTVSTFTPGLLRDLFFSGESLEKTIEKENKKKAEENIKSNSSADVKQEAEEKIEEDKEEELDKLRGLN